MSWIRRGDHQDASGSHPEAGPLQGVIVIWEYVNPHFGRPAKAQDNQVFRVDRDTAEEIDRAQAAT
jgi:hypothetical protein